jgi:hypothetical protein
MCGARLRHSANETHLPIVWKTLSFMEQHLGRNLDDVRIRSGEAAAPRQPGWAPKLMRAAGPSCSDTATSRTPRRGAGFSRMNSRMSSSSRTAAELRPTSTPQLSNEQPVRLPISSHPEDYCRGFRFRVGALRHDSAPCGRSLHGNTLQCIPKEIWMAANNTIEQVYRDAYPNDSVFFGL